tara:strand:+ start:1262 stop:1438 length:177 start_codon:yes stop_codon:yes gene_type:complete
MFSYWPKPNDALSIAIDVDSNLRTLIDEQEAVPLYQKLLRLLLSEPLNPQSANTIYTT